MHQAATDHDLTRDGRHEAVSHVYSLCFFRPGDIVPDVRLIEAASDDEAVESARENLLFTTREVWERHRLVAVIPPSQG